jgi:serpin B
VNAVYFKGTWQTKFQPSSTRNAPFHLTAKKKKSVPMMTQSGDFEYYENESATTPFQAISLPYGDGHLGLYLFLPGPKSSVDALMKELTSANWKGWISGLSEQKGVVSLPRFKMDYEAELTAPLQKLGINQMFSPSADFSNISSIKPLYVSEVLHKTTIEVNEEGTEAAAATGDIMATGNASVDEPFQFIADRPFIAAICDNATDTILFLGVVRDPQ